MFRFAVNYTLSLEGWGGFAQYLVRGFVQFLETTLFLHIDLNRRGGGVNDKGLGSTRKILI